MWDMIHLFAQLHALISVDEQTVGLNLDVFLQGQLFSDESFERCLCISKFLLKPLDVGGDFPHFLHEAVLHAVSAQLNIWSKGSVVQSCLGDFHRSLLICYGFLQHCDVLFHGCNFSHHLSNTNRTLFI